MASDLGLYCLPMSHKKGAMIICVAGRVVNKWTTQDDITDDSIMGLVQIRID